MPKERYGSVKGAILIRKKAIRMRSVNLRSNKSTVFFIKMLSFIKKIIAIILLTSILPFLCLISIVIRFTSKGPFIFKQKRAGKGKKPFFIYKIRTMVIDADNLKQNIYHLNQSDGPVFKIRNDPRYTKVGKFLSHTGLDEITQLVNIIKGEMDFVGPRPLPVEEAEKISNKFAKRFSILPGMTSPWIIKGAHSLSFNQWMNLDLQYVKYKSLLYDISIFFNTLKIIILLIIKKVNNGR